MRKLVATTIEELTDKFDTVFGYKLVAYYALGALYHHHNEVFAKATAEGDHDTALCWARDAGWLQVMLKCLNDIHLGPEDFMATRRLINSLLPPNGGFIRGVFII